MTIVNRSMYPLQSGFEQIGRMQQRFGVLQQQLATGQKASTLAELGTDRYFDLSLRNRLGRIEGYESSIDMLNLRLGAMDTVVSRLEALESESRGALTPGAHGSGNLNFGTAPAVASSRLDEALTLLNSEAGGRYLFAGNKIDERPVETRTTVLEGVGGRAGFRQIAAERLAADRGLLGMGRLSVGNLGAGVTVAEDGSHPFGLKLVGVSSTSGGVTLTQPAGAPPALGVTFTAVPAAGETITIRLTLPDGTADAVALKAVAGAAGAGEFTVGADQTTSAANFSSALGSSLSGLASGRMAVASNFAAAGDFFNGQGDPVMRVAGPPFVNATGMIAADPATTVSWYKGTDSATPRSTVTGRVDEGTVVNYGAQANESGPLELVRSLAVIAIQNFSATDPSSGARFDAVASRNINRLAERRNGENGSIEMIAVELANAQVTVSQAAERHTTQKGQLHGLLADLETVPPEEVSMEILALQTRLQASYQALALISQMSLANYLR